MKYTCDILGQNNIQFPSSFVAGKDFNSFLKVLSAFVCPVQSVLPIKTCIITLSVEFSCISKHSSSLHFS